MSYWYIGSPYSKYAEGLDAAHRDVCRFVARLINAGIPAYSPIAHTHPVAMHGELDPLDHAIWLPADKPMMDAAQGLVVLQMEGWGESYGIQHEVRVFREAGKPVYFIRPGETIDFVKRLLEADL